MQALFQTFLIASPYNGPGRQVTSCFRDKGTEADVEWTHKSLDLNAHPRVPALNHHDHYGTKKQGQKYNFLNFPTSRNSIISLIICSEYFLAHHIPWLIQHLYKRPLSQWRLWVPDNTHHLLKRFSNTERWGRLTFDMFSGSRRLMDPRRFPHILLWTTWKGEERNLRE